jgi:tetratricopeptide (TPR) repeat protein
MRIIISALVIAILSIPSLSAQTEQTESFNQAKLHLANHKLADAIPILEKLWKKDPGNANLNYLLGLCYVKEDVKIKMAVELLEASSIIYSRDYKSESNQERRAPEYVYYYLTIAYSKNGQCEDALKALNKFYQIYTYSDEYYLVDGQKWVRECNMENKEEEMPPSLVQQHIESDMEAKEVAEARVAEKAAIAEAKAEEQSKLTEEQIATQEFFNEVIQERKEPQIKERLIPFEDWDNLRTRDIVFTSMTSQYGIQIAALIDLKPTRDFNGLKNVEVYVDENGIFRYVIGRFPYRQQAESLLEKIRERGYQDAFIVDVNQHDYNREVLGLGKSNINWHIEGKVDFRVQVGAFSALVPGAVAMKYLEVDGIREVQQNGLTILTVGSFPNYEEAATFRDSLKEKGLEDAFIVAFNMGNRIPLKDAKEFVEGKQSDEPPTEDDEKIKRKGQQ